jgi:prolyl-tRNA synthetase
VRDASEQLYQTLTEHGFDVLLDDRDARPGVKFADAELYGIPHRIVIGERGLDAGTLEYRSRRATDNEDVPLADVVAFLKARTQN